MRSRVPQLLPPQLGRGIQAVPFTSVQAAVRAFFTGHSHLWDPIIPNIKLIAESRGVPSFTFQYQRLDGSSLATRQGNAPTWSGYSTGSNVSGSGLNVITDARTGLYTDVIITEYANSVEYMAGHDTVRRVRHFYDVFKLANAATRGWFYANWPLGIPRTGTNGDVANWVAMCAVQQQIWECVSTRIDDSLNAEGRSDRIRQVPVCGAFGYLVNNATTGTVPGITAGTHALTLQVLFEDAFHCTDVGKYFVACVFNCLLHGTTPANASIPATGVTSEQAANLQAQAWSYCFGYTQPTHTTAQRKTIMSSGIPTYCTWNGDGNQTAYLSLFAENDYDNPVHWQSGSDHTWLTQPA
jgi:hypothetical protein